MLPNVGDRLAVKTPHGYGTVYKIVAIEHSADYSEVITSWATDAPLEHWSLQDIVVNIESGKLALLPIAPYPGYRKS